MESIFLVATHSKIFFSTKTCFQFNLHESLITPKLEQIHFKHKMATNYALALSTPKPTFFTCLKQSSSIHCRFASINQPHFPNSCDQITPQKHVFSSNFSSRSLLHSLCSSRRLPDFKLRSAAVPESRNEAVKAEKLIRTLQLAAMFAVWYMLNIYFNIFNKQVPFLFLFCFFSFC